MHGVDGVGIPSECGQALASLQARHTRRAALYVQGPRSARRRVSPPPWPLPVPAWWDPSAMYFWLAWAPPALSDRSLATGRRRSIALRHPVLLRLTPWQHAQRFGIRTTGEARRREHCTAR
jgi:hypothetical protein